jgi:hypothetical protein
MPGQDGPIDDGSEGARVQAAVAMALLLTWRDRAFRASMAHYVAAETYEYRSKLLTLLNIVSTICVIYFSPIITKYLRSFFQPAGRESRPKNGSPSLGY